MLPRKPFLVELDGYGKKWVVITQRNTKPNLSFQRLHLKVLWRIPAEEFEIVEHIYTTIIAVVLCHKLEEHLLVVKLARKIK